MQGENKTSKNNNKTTLYTALDERAQFKLEHQFLIIMYLCTMYEMYTFNVQCMYNV